MNNKTHFFSRILLPSMLAVLMFVIAIYLFVIPNYRNSLMKGKQETIRELTNTAWSVLHKLDLMVADDFDIWQAQAEAAEIIADMRWGEELKDYFWITDTVPNMVMHPYRPALNGVDMSDYRDPAGKELFVEMVQTAKNDGSGFVDYKWQWKDDSLTVVSKLSYVKVYEPWGWIVGTGIYVDDVNVEINSLTNKIVLISLIITLIVSAIILYLARVNFVVEKQRLIAQNKLIDSMQRYKKLVEASTDGVIMMLNDEIAYCNPYIINLLGYSQSDFEQRNPQFFETLESFYRSSNKINNDEKDLVNPEISTEQRVNKKNGVMVDVVVNSSTFDIDGKQGIIYAVKDVSKHKDVERELDLNMEKFKSIANLMYIGVFRCTLGRQARFIEINHKMLDLLGYKMQSDLHETHVQELFVVDDEKKEVARAINEGFYVKDKLIRLKRSDGSTIPVIVTLFPVNDAYGKTVFCDGIIVDAYDQLSRNFDFNNSSSTIQLTANILLQPIAEYLLPAPLCDTDISAEAAAKLMAKTKSDIVLIEGGDSSVLGLLTHSDISRRVVAKGRSSSIKVSEIMSSPIIYVSDNDMVIDAFSLMVQHRISYVVVKPKSGKNYSYISLLNLSELRKDTPEFLINEIRKAASVYEISSEMERLPFIIRNLVETGIGATKTGKIISKISDTITEKLIEEAIQELGKPPVEFVFLALGSEGRREQTLATDQDNAIVYKSRSKNEDKLSKDYFLKLGSKVCNMLDKSGYPICKGGVMAMNEQWCMSEPDWQNTISTWVNIPNPQEILNVSIFFDFRPVFGSVEIANSLNKYCQNLLKDKNVFFHNLALGSINLKLPSADNLKNKEHYDIKMPILAITGILRFWTLKYGIGERNSIERILALEAAGVFSSALRAEFENAYRFLMLARIKNQLYQIDNKQKLSNIINPKQFSEIEILTLKKVINTINEQQKLMSI